MHLPEVKVCGITRTEDAENALNLGASKLGFILYHNSQRCIKLEEVLRIKDDLNLQPDKMVAVEVVNFGNFWPVLLGITQQNWPKLT